MKGSKSPIFGKLLFGGPFLFGVFFVAVMAALVWLTFCVRGAVDHKGYQKLIVSLDPSQGALTPHTSQHARLGVVKEVILSHEPFVRRARLVGNEAILVLDRDQEGTHVLEHLTGVTAYLQDSLLEKGGKKEQIVHLVVAGSLSCDYPRDLFIAKNAVIHRLLSPGHEIDEEISQGLTLVTAESSHAEIHLKTNTILLGGGVTVKNGKGRAFADEVTLTPDQIILNHNVNFSDALGDVFADHCTLYLTEGQREIQKVHLSGAIRLVNTSRKGGKAMQYALAERVDYFPDSGEMLLYASENGRVLFYDPEEEFQMSAPAIKVQRNRKTKEHSVQGLGDVRLHFAEEEQQEIKRRFL